MKKSNPKLALIIFPVFIVLFLLLPVDGMIGAFISGAISSLLTYPIAKLLRIDTCVYYNHKGEKITKNEYEKLENKIDYSGLNFLKDKKRK
jgi:uncharacterized membrane protein